MNPLMQSIGNNALEKAAIFNNPQIMQAAQSAKRMMNMLKTAQNPQAAIMQVAQQNPQLNAVMQMCNGRNPKDVFVDQCKQHGVNPDEAIKQIQQMLS